MQELFRSRNLLVRSRPAADTSRWVIAFDSFTDSGFAGTGLLAGTGLGAIKSERRAFGEDYLVSRDISVISVLGRDNRWYQYPEMQQALSRIAAATRGAGRVVAYGSSMGGYAAARFADALNADTVLALSPQYSCDPGKVPFEQRWRWHTRRIRWRPELDGPIRSRARTYVAFDPHISSDARHAALIARDAGCDLIEVPDGGHPVAAQLNQLGLLTGMIPDILAGTFDVAAFRDATGRATPARQDIYRSDNLAVRRMGGGDPGRIIVTFDTHSSESERPLERAAWLQAYLASLGIAVIAAVGRGSHWYQYPDIGDAVAKIAEQTAGVPRVIAYGSGMGGYAALRFADIVGAQDVVAFSPHYSRDPSVAPFERRWRSAARSVAWRPDMNGPLHCRAQPLVFYDPVHRADARHAALIARDTPTRLVELPYCGSPVNTYLHQAKLLYDIIPAVLGRSFDVDAFQREALARRGQTDIYRTERLLRFWPFR